MDTAIFRQAWLEVFPNSACSFRKVMGGADGCFNGRLLRDEEQINKITQNDPLGYVGWLEGTTYREDRAHLFVRPPEGANLVYGRVNLRRKTIKDVTYEKLVKRFEEVREFVRANKDNMKHNIEGKV